MAARSKLLICKRDSCEKRIESLKVWIDANLNATKNIIEVRLQKAEETYTEFFECIAELEATRPDPNNQTVVNNFETVYFETVAKAKYMIDKNKVVKASLKACDEIKLPEVQLPSFYGSYDAWYNFKEAFKGLIGDKTNLSDIQKFFYLKSCLKGAAAQILNGLEVTANNYSVALRLLEERFENLRLIVNTHVQALFELEIVQRDNHVSLRKLMDKLRMHLSALQQLNQPVSEWDTLVIYIVLNKLDLNTRRAWEGSQKGTAVTKLKDLLEFLSEKCRILETLGNKDGQKIVKGHAVNVAQCHKMVCGICQGDHKIFKCEAFLGLAIADRIEKVKQLKICFNCLNGKHWAKECTYFKCKICRKDHNVLLHKKSEIPRGERTEVVEHVNTHCRTGGEEQVLLTTAKILVLNKKGNYIEMRALLDSGSDCNFITASAYKNLGLSNEKKTSIQIQGIGMTKNSVGSLTNLKFKSQYKDYRNEITCFIIENITSLIPLVKFKVKENEIPDYCKLADEKFNIPQKIDILIGAGIFYDLLLPNNMPLGKGKPILRETKLGWILTGSIKVESGNGRRCNLSVSQRNIENELSKFWEIENVETINEAKINDCEKLFAENVTRAVDNKFIVKLPMRGDLNLGDNSVNAYKRFQMLENRFAKNNELKIEYCKFMDEYLSLSHMEFIKAVKVVADIEVGAGIYYIPHHAVYKRSSATTKLRVVFDASSKTDSGNSLNDLLQIGPVIQDDIFAILLRFRLYNVVLIADIEKMYRQVWVSSEFTDFQRIFWRGKETDSIGIYKLKTLTYGTGPASFLATRCLKQLALENKEIFPKACEVIQNSFYMDDLITGGKNETEVLNLKRQVVNILEKGGFNLRKFNSNKENVLRECLRDNPVEHVLKNFEEDKTLGIKWNSTMDIITFGCDFGIYKRHTKRTILSEIGKIFDPLGLLSPIIIRCKILMQELWNKGLDWDEELPINLDKTWQEIISDVQKVNLLQIPRHTLLLNFETVEIHAFCDASEKAYGCAIYLRSIGKNEIRVSLLCAKTKVAPIKRVSIPRLELCGAVLLVKLLKRVNKALNLKIEKIRCWTDSNVALCWIKGENKIWKTFVQNRVNYIHENTNIMQWAYVKGKNNPADLLTRGVLVKELIEKGWWWNGPEWLVSEKGEYETKYEISAEASVEERRVLVTVQVPYDEIFTKYSSFMRLKRVVAYVIRFKNNCTNGKLKRLGFLTTNELKESEMKLILLVQRGHFKNERDSLALNNRVNRNSRILSLNPIMDETGIIRVGGRLRNSNLDYESKYPIILHKEHIFVKRLIEHEHKRLLHAGTNTVLASLRQKYWIVAGESIVKSILGKCVICCKANPRILQPIMGDLPALRVTQARPFCNVALDYGGPFLIKNSFLKNRKFIKSYLCLFVCQVTKAVHLELVTDLTTQSFLNVLRRFIARRGLPNNIYSDNGTNFIGAYTVIKETKQELEKLNKSESFQNYLVENEIKWHFMPARSPHFGGLHEAGIKSVKIHLRKIMGNACLTYEELQTLLCQVEAILNSRPLVSMSSNLEDITVLTPAHFLIGQNLNDLPEQDLMDVPTSKLKKFEQLQRMKNQFWKTWRRDYLSQLQERPKWKTGNKIEMKVGDLVLVKEDNLSVRRWKLARITQLHPGEDGVLRVVELKTHSGITTCAVRNICKIPVE